MNRVEYNQFVREIEKRYHGRPGELEKISHRYIVCSYLYIGFVILATLALVVACVAIPLRWPSAFSIVLSLVFGLVAVSIIISIFRGINLRVPPPSGVRLVKSEVPRLFEVLDELIAKMPGAKFDRVTITGDFNAAISPIPRLGILGLNQNYLVLGLPLMQALNLEELKSVLAHERSHLINKDGSWINRIRSSWEQLIENTGGTIGGWALAPFVNWFWPRFNGHAFVLSRQHEYRADADSVDCVGSAAVASSLQKVNLYSRIIDEEGWAPMFQLANEQAEPPDNPFQQIQAVIERSLESRPELRVWMAQSFARPTDYSDTHPSLKERLLSFDALPREVSNGEPLTLPLVVPELSSAKLLLGGDKVVEFQNELNLEWVKSIKPLWTERHDEVGEIRKFLGSEDDVTDARGSWKWADAMLNLTGVEAAMPWIEKTLEFKPEHISARFYKGCYLIEKSEPEGVPLLEQVIEEEPTLGHDALGMLREYYSNIGDAKRYNDVDRLADKLDTELEEAMQERSQMDKKSQFEFHGVSTAELELVTKELSEFTYIHSCYLAQKKVQFFPKSPAYVLIVVPASNVDDSVTQSIAGSIAPLLNGQFFVGLKSKQKGVAKVVMAMPDTLIYEKDIESD